MAIPVLTAWTVLAAARNAAWYGKADPPPPWSRCPTWSPPTTARAPTQGGGAGGARGRGRLSASPATGQRLGRGRWVLLALLTGGVISVYSLAGGAPGWRRSLGLWLVGLLAIAAWRRRLGEVPGVVRRELPALGIGIGVLAARPNSPKRTGCTSSSRCAKGTGISTSDVGNLIARLPGWEALRYSGRSRPPDYRLLTPTPAACGAGSWSSLILFGTFWAVRRGRWLLAPGRSWRRC